MTDIANDSPSLRSSLFQSALEEVRTEMDAELRAQPFAQPPKDLVEGTLDAIGAVGTGIAKAGFETKDAITTGFGLWPDNKPTYEQKSDFRKQIENDAAVYDRKSPLNAVLSDIAQFATGMVGLGKITQGLKIGSTVGRVSFEMAKGAVVGATVFDPQEERLSNFIESYPQFHNPVSEYLAASPTDSDAEGRFKAALEGVGLDLAIAGVFGAAVKVFKLVKSGAPKEAIQAAEAELEAAQAVQAEAQAAQVPSAPNLLDPALASKTAQGDTSLQAAMAGEQSADPTVKGLMDGLQPKPQLPGDANTILKAQMDGRPTRTITGKDGKVIGSAPIEQKPGGPVEITIKGGSAPQTIPGESLTIGGVKHQIYAADMPTGPMPKNTDPIISGRAAVYANGRWVDGQVAQGGNYLLAADGKYYKARWDGLVELAPNDPLPTKPPQWATKTQAASAPVETQAAPAPAPAPVPKAPQDIETEDLNALMQGWEADSKAIATYGSREAAEENGYRFGQAGQLPWQKLQAEGDLKAFTDRVAETFKTRMDTMKGGDVLSDARVNAMVGQRAWLYGDDPATVMGMIRTAGQNANSMVANMEAGFLIANKALSDTYRLASQIRMGSLADFGGDALAAEKALRQRLRLAVEALGQSRAMTAAAGRSLRRMRGEFRVSPEQIAQLESLDIDRITSLIYESQGNPKKLAKMADPGFIDRVVRGTGSIMANNLLWGWPSHVVNTVTSAYMSGIRPAERIVGSFFNKGGSAMRTQALREYRYMVSSLGDAWHFASQAFKTGDSVLSPHQTEWFKAASNSIDGSAGAKGGAFVPMNTVGDLYKNGFTALDLALRFPTRALGTIDELIKQMSYRGYVQAEASIRADELGLKGVAFKTYVEDALDQAFDAANGATDKNALYEAQVRTFSQPLLAKTYGSTLQNAVAVHPSLRAIFPFVRTPVNVFRYSIKMMPGLNLLQREYREMISGKMGPELQANAIGQMVTGSLALAVAGSLTADGRMTGGGPREPSLRQALEATGWKPYSFVIERPDGSHTYLPYNRFDPVGLLFGTAADITELAVTYPDAQVEDLAVALGVAVAKNITDKTYLQSVNAFMRAATDPERSSAKWAGQLAESLIPFSSLLRQANPDPYMREARTMVDNALDRIPGFSDKLPPLRDPFGYPMKVRTGLVFQDNADDIVDAEQIRLITETGKGIALPTGFKREGMDLRDMHLTVDGKDRTAWDLLQELSIKPKGAKETMKEALAKEITSDRYGMAPDGAGDVPGTKLFLLRRIVGQYREAAYKELLRTYPKEIGEPIARRALAAKEAWRKAKGGGQASASQMDQLREFAGSYGLRPPL